MAVFLFDSSALVKRYLKESGSQWVRTTLQPATGHTILVAQTTPVELVAAVTRRMRGGFLSVSDADEVISDIVYDTAIQYQPVFMTHDVVKRAMTLSRVYGLRGYDAIQLGTAIHVLVRQAGEEISPVRFVCSDQELIQAAVAEGVVVFNPNHVA